MPASVQRSVHAADTTPAPSAPTRRRERSGLRESLGMLGALFGTLVLVSSLFWR
ncbi:MULTISPECIES: hypothetical protein [Cupriavidus]|uniref:hypothetical protein n=1 Tax=Cupriavidus TaxID=106589 RepID=UPI00168B15E4|nr:hypothetical protein [Cupriavidus pauculus]